MENKKKEYCFEELYLMIFALEQLDTSMYEEVYKETHRLLLERFRELIKEI